MHFHREDRDNEGEEEGRIKTKSKAAGAPPGASSAAVASAAPPPTVLDVEEDTETKDARSRSPRGVAPTVIDVEENTETKDARSRSLPPSGTCRPSLGRLARRARFVRAHKAEAQGSTTPWGHQKTLQRQC